MRLLHCLFSLMQLSLFQAFGRGNKTLEKRPRSEYLAEKEDDRLAPLEKDEGLPGPPPPSLSFEELTAQRKETHRRLLAQWSLPELKKKKAGRPNVAQKYLLARHQLAERVAFGRPCWAKEPPLDNYY